MSQAQLTSSSTVRGVSVKNFLNLNLKQLTGVGVKVLLCRKIKSFGYADHLLALFFFSNFHVYVERKDICVIDFSASERQNCLLHFVIARVPSSLIPA